LRVLGSEQNHHQKVFNRESLRMCWGHDILKVIKTLLSYSARFRWWGVLSSRRILNMKRLAALKYK